VFYSWLLDVCLASFEFTLIKAQSHYSVCERTSMYVVLYAQANSFFEMFKIVQHMRAYSIYVTHTLNNTRDIRLKRKKYVKGTLLIRYTNAVNTPFIRL